MPKIDCEIESEYRERKIKNISKDDLIRVFRNFRKRMELVISADLNFDKK